MSKKKVLIVEDDPEDFKYLKEWADSMDFHVLPTDHQKMTSAISSKKICDFVTKQIDANYKNIKLILCDIMFGRNYTGGNEVVKCIREHKVKNFEDWTSKVPIFGVTQNEDLLCDIISDGANDVFTKNQIKDENYEKTIRKKIRNDVKKFEEYTSKMEITNNKKVFIVHGHNNGLKQEVARVIEHLNLKPIILHEKPNMGQALIEKFESNSYDVGFAIILLTADDLGRLKTQKEKDNKLRARQNVIFEMGYFMSRLSRSHVFILREDNIEEPSDLNGIMYNKLSEDWKMELVCQLQKCGYDVDANNLIHK